MRVCLSVWRLMLIVGLLATYARAVATEPGVKVHTSTANSGIIVIDPKATPRELYGVERLRTTLAASSFHLPSGAQVFVGVRSSPVFAAMSKLARFDASDTEAFHLAQIGTQWLVVGSDASGVLYGCMELAKRSAAAHSLPEGIDVTDRPAFKIRGTNLFWMKKSSYNWPVTPKEFPWFYDRRLMTQYLDELAANRFNTFIFWNGHPFPYFLKLSRYPEAAMLRPAELERNMAALKWFTEEADRRGIWTVFHFYNIHVSPAMAAAHRQEGMQVENPVSTPLLAAYTRYCIGEFVKSYPSVGLMLTAGEALRVKREEFIRDTIIPGIKDSGKTPPLIIRQWMIYPDRYRDVVKPNYSNLYTMMKHNTEMIVSPYPDPRNQLWISMGRHLINLHELADVKPFRWGSPVFIEQMVRIWKRMGVSGYQVYPMTSWMWPDSLDRSPLLTINRDRIWLEAFGRYGWQPDRPAAEEAAYWQGKMAARFGSVAAGKAVYDFYVNTGPILPGFQNIVNIYNMNYHPTALAQEATLNGILHSDRMEDVDDPLARPLDALTLELYEQRFGALDPAARMRPPTSVKDYLKPHPAAPDPIKVSELFVKMSEQAVVELKSEQASATREADEYARFVNDAECVLDLARFYENKIEAAVEKGRYDTAQDQVDYQQMLAKMDASVTAYRSLTGRATLAYQQPTDLGDWYQWKTVLGSFESEDRFYHEQANIAKAGPEVVYLGVDGPVNDATNEFHWLLEAGRKAAGWKSQSYDLGPNPFEKARLVVVYGLESPQFQQYSGALDKFVRKGGKLVIWDPVARAYPSPLLAGLTFSAKDNYRTGNRFGFASAADPLLHGLSGTQFTLPQDNTATLASNIRSASSDWQELAYTVLTSVAQRQFYDPGETYGPRWTSLMDTAQVPLLVIRRLGAGEIVLAQLGSYHLQAYPASAPPTPPRYLRILVDNLVDWAKVH